MARKTTPNQGRKISVTWQAGDPKEHRINLLNPWPIVIMFLGVIALAGLGIWLAPDNQLFWQFMTAVIVALFAFGRDTFARPSGSKPQGPDQPA